MEEEGKQEAKQEETEEQQEGEEARVRTGDTGRCQTENLFQLILFHI